MSPTFHGVDIYHGNLIINAAQIPPMDVFTHKATEGGVFNDPACKQRLDMFAGVKRRGVYHWMRSDFTVDQQAANFQQAINRLGLIKAGELIPGVFLMLDWETTLKNGKPLPPVTCAQVEHLTSILHGLYGDRVIVYTSDWVPDFQLWRARNPKMPLWYANYNLSSLPTGGPAECAKYRATCWQYTSSAVVPGFKSPVDANTVLDWATLNALADLSTAPPITPPLLEPPALVLPAHTEEEDMPTNLHVTCPGKPELLISIDGSGATLLGLSSPADAAQIVAAAKANECPVSEAQYGQIVALARTGDGA